MSDLDKKNAPDDLTDLDYRKAVDDAYPQPSFGFHDRVMAEIRSLREQENKKRKLTVSLARWGSLAACFVLLVAVVVFVASRGGNLENRDGIMTAEYSVSGNMKSDGSIEDEPEAVCDIAETSALCVINTSGETGGIQIPSDTCSYFDMDSTDDSADMIWYGEVSEVYVNSQNPDVPGAARPDPVLSLSALNSAILMNSANNSYEYEMTAADSRGETEEKAEDLREDFSEFMNYSVPMWANCSRIMNPPKK